MRWRLILIGLMAFAALAWGAAAEDYVLVDAKDWRDVYSGVLYAKVLGLPDNFLVSERHAYILVDTTDPKLREIFYIRSDNPYAIGLERSFEGRGHTVETLRYGGPINLALAERLARDHGIDSFIVIDDSYGFNAISAAPYAVVSESYVIFGTSETIDDVIAFLDRNARRVMVYGYVTPEVAQALVRFAPETIDSGNRFDDNIEIHKRYLALRPRNQTLVTGGDIIEESLMEGFDPVLLLGRDEVPPQVREYLAKSGIETLVLVGNEFVGTVKNLKDTLGIRAFVKFGRTARQLSGTFDEIEGLDVYRLPEIQLGLEVTAARYNLLTGTLEVNYRNTGSVREFIRATITARRDGSEFTFGDENEVLIEAGKERTVGYQVRLDRDAATADFFIFYGDGPRALDRTLETSVPIQHVEVEDRCELALRGVSYDVPRNSFFVSLENGGDADCHADVELREIIIGGEETTLMTEAPLKIEAGAGLDVRIRQRLTDYDLEDNPWVRAVVYYGQREDALIKTIDETIELRIRTATNLIWVVSLVALLVILAFLFFRRRRKRNAE
ncbi:hypothetical protein JXB02_00025 [Candidatus Woesearchaeota archaeon]|nr:hypothetical protein [Candidatus Woesearchaeota archaeon]